MLREPDSTLFAADALFDDAPVGLALLDHELRLVRLNDALAELAGLRLAEHRGRPLTDLLPVGEAALEALLAGEPTSFELVLPAGPGRSGGRRWLARAFPLHEPRSEASVGLAVVEVHERSQAGLWASRQREVLDAIAAGAALHEVLELVTRMIQADIGGLASILLVDDDGLHVRHGAGPDLPTAYRQAIDGLAIGPSAGSCGTAMHRRERVIVEDIATDELWERYRAVALPFGLRACWSSPILSCDGSVLGSFAVYHSEPCRPGLQEISVIEAATSLAGIAIERSRTEAALRRNQARESALRRVATTIAGAATPLEVVALVAGELVHLLGVSLGAVVRFDGEHALVVARSGEADVPGPELGDRYDPATATALGAILRTGYSADGELARLLGDNGYTAAVGAPITVEGRLWGAVLAWTRGQTAMPHDAEAQLEPFAELAAMAIANADAQARLATQAHSDPLTGLANHRVFQERLRAAVRSAKVGRRPLSLVLFDVDGFKQVNDSFGHQRGDRLLAEIAGLLGEVSRAGETLARLGGDEFALVLPGSSAEAAERVAERLRASVARALGTTTLSAGVCDLAHASSADELFRLADGALYWAKGHGRNVVVRYQPETIADLTAGERAERLARSQTLKALRALAQAVDAKDESTGRHSERVAGIARTLAELRGWPSARVALLHEAALVHDVGKIGVRDEILRKPGPLSAAEFDEMRGHAALGARIVHEVLGPEQVAWLRYHHERVDGTGYPDGLAGEQIPEGAALLALADAWDVMTSDRPYRQALRLHEALAECRRMRGTQFSADAVDALLRLYAANAA